MTCKSALERPATLIVRFSGPTESILDRLDIFSDATDAKNTLVILFFLGPHSRGAVHGVSTFRYYCPGILEDNF